MPKFEQIALEQERFLSLLPEVLRLYGQIPGVDLIGLGAKERNGNVTEEWAWRFYVQKKRSPDKLPESEKIPAEIFGVQTDVIARIEEEKLVCDASVLHLDSGEYRDNGIHGGITIRNEFFGNDHASGYGTLGVLARRTADNKLVGLTCAHVVNAAADSFTAVGTKIGQPKYWVSCCCCPRGRIGVVATATFTTDLDCALILIDDDDAKKVENNSTETKIEGITGEIIGTGTALLNDTVRKRGRATGLTTGRVIDIAFGTNHMLVELTGGSPNDPFACHGDSGSVLINAANEIVGLLVAADRSNMKRAIATHIAPVVTNLGFYISEIPARLGGYANHDDNETEVFNSTDFGLTGPVDWDLGTGSTSATIVETSDTRASNRASITVMYDTICPDSTSANAVIIQAKSSGNTVTKRRTVSAGQRAAWPGGQGDTTLNPEEAFANTDFGFGAGDSVKWKIATRGTTAAITELNGAAGAYGTSATGTSIKVRYDTQSPGTSVVQSVIVQASFGGVTKEKSRTVFTITPQAANTNAALFGFGGAGGAAGRNDLRYPAGYGSITQAGVVDTTMVGVTVLSAKMEQPYTISPLGIPWTRRLVSFVFDDPTTPISPMTNVKFELRTRRERQAVILAQITGSANRIFPVVNQDGTPANDAAFVNDGFADPGDCQYPTDVMPNHIFRIDYPGVNAGVLDQFTLRSNFREFCQFHNGITWIRVTPHSPWFANLTMALPTVANPSPNLIAPNTSGTGAGAANINNTTPVINGGVDQNVARGANVTLTATFSDADNDTQSGTFIWTQTAGPSVIPGGVFNGNPLVFTAPGAVTVLTFTVQADDLIVTANSYNPGNSRGSDTVNVTVH